MDREDVTTQPGVTLASASVVDLSPDPQAWDDFVAAADSGSYLQMTPWVDVKAANHWLGLRFMGSGVPLRPVTDGGPSGADGGGPLVPGTFGAQLLLRRPPVFRWALAYAPGGPVCDRWDAATVEAMTDGVRQAAASAPLTVSHVRIEPEVEANGPHDRDGSLRATLRRLGWRTANRTQPPSVRRIDLTLDEEGLWHGLTEGSRREIGQARDGGIVVVEGDAERLRDFYAVYRQGNSALGLPVRTEQSYRRIWSAFRPRSMPRLLFAQSASGEPLATLFLLAAPSRIAEAYGGMTPAGATAGAGHLLKWEAILSSKRAGAKRYDMPQVEDSPSAAFDAAFGGREATYIGAWELVLDSVGRFATETAIAARNRYYRHVGGPLGRRAARDAD